MADELVRDAFGVKFIERQGKERAWHMLGEVFPADEKITATVAAERVRGLYPVSKEPLHVKVGDLYIPIPEAFGIFREYGTPNMQFFGTCHKDYEIVSVQQLLPYIDPITERWNVETAGVMRDGKFFFLVCKTGDTKVAGEDIARYFFILIPYEPGKSIQVTATDVRVVCMNTCIMALEHNQFSIPVAHTSGAESRFKLIMDFAHNLQIAQEESLNAMETLAAYEMQAGDIHKIAWATYPDPVKPKMLKAFDNFKLNTPASLELESMANEIVETNTNYSYFLGRQAKMRINLISQYEKLRDELNRDTAWEAYNAVTGIENHRRGKGNTGAAEGILLNTGDRNQNMRNGFTAALALAESREIPLKYMRYMPEIENITNN